MNAKTILFRCAGLLAGALILPAFAAAAEADALPVATENYIQYGAGGMQVSGSKAAAQARTQTPKVGAAGIEAFNLTRELSKESTFIVDGKALPGAEDYLLSFKLTKNEVGSVEAGYKSFRTFYDGAGGFFPTNNAWFPLFTRPLHVDRGQFFLRAEVALPKAPVWTLRYTHATRDGRKNSTILGDTSNTGIPNYSLSSLNPVSIARKILPAYIDLDEKQQTFELAVRQTFGATTARLSLVGNTIDNLDSRNVDRFVGELRPFPAIPANPVTIIPPALSNNPNRGFDIQGVEETSWTLAGSVETVLSEKATAYANVSYRTAEGDITGSRLITISMNSTVGVISGIGGFTSGGRPPYSYTSAGTTQSHLYTAVAGVRLSPAKDLALDVRVKAEDSDVLARNTATYVSTSLNQTTGAVLAPQRDALPNWSRTKEKLWAPELDVRYTGIRKVALFGNIDYRTAPGDERLLGSAVGPGPAGTTVVATTLSSFAETTREKHLNAKVGASWTPHAALSLRSELYRKDHEDRFADVGAAGLYVLDYDITGYRLVATVRPTPMWAFTTRYNLQVGKTATTTDVYARGDSKNSKRHAISQLVTWTPTKQLYVQANVNLVFDTISTAYPVAGGVANDVLRNADNNYWNGSVLAGFAVDKLTNAFIQATYYKANNYEPALAAATVPYGARGKEYGLSLGATRKLSEKWTASAKLGYFESKNDTLGGNADFHGPVGYVSLQQAF